MAKENGSASLQSMLVWRTWVATAKQCMRAKEAYRSQMCLFRGSESFLEKLHCGGNSDSFSSSCLSKIVKCDIHSCLFLPYFAAEFETMHINIFMREKF